MRYSDDLADAADSVGGFAALDHHVVAVRETSCASAVVRATRTIHLDHQLRLSCTDHLVHQTAPCICYCYCTVGRRQWVRSLDHLQHRWVDVGHGTGYPKEELVLGSCTGGDCHNSGATRSAIDAAKFAMVVVKVVSYCL